MTITIMIMTWPTRTIMTMIMVTITGMASTSVGGARLSTVFRPLGHTEALQQGTIRPKHFEIDYMDIPVLIQAFRRMVRGLEFDVCELAFTTYLCAKEYGKPFTAIPVFPARVFHHGAVLYNVKSGVRVPKDLEGKTVGVHRGYTVTTGVWARGILQEEYGVDLKTITWLLSGDEHVEEFRAPANVVPIEKGKKLEDMLASGEIPAAINVEVEHPDVKPLIPHPVDAGFDALQSRGHYPINHTVVVKDELLRAYPDLGKELFDAFVAAKRPYVEQLKNGELALSTKTDQTYKRVLEITGADPLPYGVEPNRRMIEAVIGYARQQGILSRSFPMAELFAFGTLNLVG
jgi:ABC-type nitrate/sulfonate/bicarbonate transport system substrate-binding protein